MDILADVFLQMPASDLKFSEVEKTNQTMELMINIYASFVKV
jgi:hypothetical protein